MLTSGRHLLLEGPVGVGKTTVALAVCAHLARGTVRVDGDDRYTENKLTGWFDPPVVLKEGYGPAAFFPGPLVAAMRTGSVLFINELNRMPEAVQNVLLPALDEGIVHLPHIGTLRAAEGFQVVATQNPAEGVAAGHLSEALRDRFERLAVDYQPAAEELAIVAGETDCKDAALVLAAVRLTRATRLHRLVAKGASIRGAIATVTIAEGLRAAESPATGGGGRSAAPGSWGNGDRATLRRAAAAALSTRIDLHPDGDVGFAEVLDEVFDLVVDRGEDPDVALLPVDAAGELREGATDDPGACPAPPPQTVSAPPDPQLALAALADRYRLPEATIDGWQVALNLTRSDRGITDPELRCFAEQLAAAAVLARAARLVGPLRGATRVVSETPQDPHSGELDVQATLENVLGKTFPEPGDWVIRRREERRHQVCLMVDASPSMEGENMAVAAVATAVLALKLRPEDLSVVLFDRSAYTVTRLGAPDPPGEVVRRMLANPIRPRTNIAAALERGAAELELGRNPRRSGLLITDGAPTMGGDPVPYAHRFSRLFVLRTDDDDLLPSQRRQAGPLCRRLADAGGGEVFMVRAYQDLPRRLLDVADRMLR